MQNIDNIESRNQQENWEFVIYIAGNTPACIKAHTTLLNLCQQYLEGRYKVKVIDIYKEPESATDAKIFAIPTTIKVAPLPKCTVIGDLSDVENVVAELNLN